MFQNEELKAHLESSSTIELNSLVIAEWNMNIAENIAQIGNYRYRKFDQVDTKYNTIVNSFDFNDEDSLYYTGATDADIVIDGGYLAETEDNGDLIPVAFTQPKEKEKLLYSLEDCFARFRPRSGINKARYFDDKYLHFSGTFMADRPRYYMSDRNDTFQYWSSFRTENGERGIANQDVNGLYFIDDTAPYVVYKNQVPTNRIVVKMQTNVGTVDLGSFKDFGYSYDDPFYGYNNQTTPVRWKVQYLYNNSWIDAISFNENSLRRDGSQVIGPDGYVEIVYGLKVPNDYIESFYEVNPNKVYTSSQMLPDPSNIQDGSAYLVKLNETDIGSYYIVDNGQYSVFTAEYGWYLYDESNSKRLGYVTNMTSPSEFYSINNLGDSYKEFQNITGLRVVVETMNVYGSTFDLIELSPRLVADLSDKTVNYSITKPASDLGVTGLPVGQLLASTGTLSLFDYDQAFFPENTNSIIYGSMSQSIQFKFYEIIQNVNGNEYYVPIKTMYADSFPSISNSDRSVSFNLRDLFFYFESLTAPQILLQNASLSSAISMLLDNAGFSNYIFRRVDDEPEDVIPFFFVEPDVSVAQVLSDLALSTQTAMFFDEYNNFVCMSRNYLMPSETDRETDFVFYGTKDFVVDGAIKNKESTTNGVLANIVDISFKNNEIFNDGIISYTSRDIQKSYGTYEEAFLQDKDKTWIYKPSLLWQISGTEQTKSVNQDGFQQSYALTAIPLNSDLTIDLPVVINHQIQNNVIDLGEAIFWIARYDGYFFANGEIIRYDAVQYSIPGLSATDENANSDNVWITSAREYAQYFSKIPFNGKMYPTGLIRIYSEPNYEEIDGITRLQNGAVAKHGRGQFGTEIVAHNAGLSAEWSSNSSVRGIDMASQYLFDSLSRVRVVTNVSLVSNIDNAVFELSEDQISLINVGDYVEKYVTLGQTVDETINIIPEDTVVIAIQSGESGAGESGAGESGALGTPGVGQITLSNEILSVDEENPIDSLKIVTRVPDNEIGAAGIDNSTARSSSRTGLIANFMSKEYNTELPTPTQYPATIQSSALVFEGPSTNIERPRNFVSYVYKELPENRFVHFGTRMRVIGKIENSEIRKQTPLNAVTYYTAIDAKVDQSISIAGGSGGIGIFVNPSTNNGYYFEIMALTDSVTDNYEDVIFYKVKKEAGVENSPAIPIKLWSGLAGIYADDGRFTGQSRAANESSTTVYDLGVEYEVSGSGIIFTLLLNNQVIATVYDEDPLPIYNNIALFVRGGSRCMFENVYALSENYGQNSVFSLDTITSSAFESSDINANDSFRKYAMSGIIQSSYLAGIGVSEPPKYKIYFEEFGTIMREAAYFNIRYDLAYPALLARIRPTFSRVKTYTVSGFRAGAYGAEFLLFNNTDFVINIGADTENALEIQGVPFTQQSDNELRVDDFFEKQGSFSNPQFVGQNLTYSPSKIKEEYRDIKLNRISNGRREFNIAGPYIQNYDAAHSVMSWLASKIMKPRKSVGLEIFPTPTLQLGDIVRVEYENADGIKEISSSDTRFVIYHIEYSRNENGPSMQVYLSEVTN